MKKTLKVFKYIFIFVFIFCIFNFLCYSLNYGDSISFYGFSNALVRGQIPYLDFNIISTPLYIFYCSIGLNFCNTYIIFLLEHILLVTIMIYLLERVFGKKLIYIFLVIVSFGFYAILPTYNFMCFFMLIVILFLEKEFPDKDYLIGFFIGLAILSKHTIGVFFVIPSLIFYFNDRKKILKRFFGLLIPCLIFLIYLIYNKALYSFIDLAFLGIFDFSNENGNYFSVLSVVSIIMLIISIVFTFKVKKNILNYYLIFTFFFVFPLFDFNHFTLYMLGFSLLFIPYLKEKAIYLKLPCLVAIFLFLYNYGSIEYLGDTIIMKDVNNFDCLTNRKYKYESLKRKNKILKEYDNAIILSCFTMTYDIINDNDIDYFGVPLYGNFGYDGTNKMIKKIRESKRQIIVLDMECYNDKVKHSQFNKKAADYVMKNYDLLEEKDEFRIYHK